METENGNVGRQIKLIIRQPNGSNSVYTGVLIGESETSFTIRTTRGEERSEPKIWCAVEWLSPKNVGVRA